MHIEKQKDLNFRAEKYTKFTTIVSNYATPLDLIVSAPEYIDPFNINTDSLKIDAGRTWSQLSYVRLYSKL